MIEIREIIAPEVKSEICNDVLRSIPDWFGDEESLMDYVAGVQDKPFHAVMDGDAAVGFVSIVVHNQYTGEIYVMGIKEAYHGQGIGRKLVNLCVDFCRENGMEFLTVKTLDASREDAHYERTRKFYYSVGFKPLEVFTTIWGEVNPCLFMAMHVNEYGRK
ncbi:MAG: GNAT family N-acetyltransferase [Defluviitaleaceae bacterium]|nr:GNAT family N-acetyltransferase [Defluviitaleaceae bacterium]